MRIKEMVRERKKREAERDRGKMVKQRERKEKRQAENKSKREEREAFDFDFETERERERATGHWPGSHADHSATEEKIARHLSRGEDPGFRIERVHTETNAAPISATSAAAVNLVKERETLGVNGQSWAFAASKFSQALSVKGNWLCK